MPALPLRLHYTYSHSISRPYRRLSLTPCMSMIPPLMRTHREDSRSHSKQVLVLLQVESPLVLQPSPVVLDTGDLLAIIVGRWVLRTRGRGIGAVAFDASVEGFLFLRDQLIPTSACSPHAEHSIAKRRTSQPAKSSCRECGNTQHDDRVQAGYLRSPGINVVVHQNRRCDSDRDDGCKC